MEKEIHGLFPVPIMLCELGRDLTKAEYSKIQELCSNTRRNEGNTTSQNSYVLEDKELSNLNNDIQLSINEYVKEIINPINDVSPYITQSWLNITNAGEYHHKHSHSNSYISGVFYIEADEQNDAIKFFKPYNKYQQIKLTPKDWNLHNSETWWFNVKKGLIVLFPSYLEHMVEMKQGDNKRISLAFNTFLQGNLGFEAELTELKIYSK